MSVVVCPGCGIERPAIGIAYDRKFHASAECWALFEQVIAREFESAVLFGQAHQLTVDAYALQHAGGAHPDKSVAVHLAGLHLSLERGLRLYEVPAWLQRIASATPSWPHLEPPAPRPRGLNIRNVAESRSPDRHIAAVRSWAEQVWETWRPHHAAARALADLGAADVPRARRGTGAPRSGRATDAPRARGRTGPRA